MTFHILHISYCWLTLSSQIRWNCSLTASSISPPYTITVWSFHVRMYLEPVSLALKNILRFFSTIGSIQRSINEFKITTKPKHTLKSAAAAAARSFSAMFYSSKSARESIFVDAPLSIIPIFCNVYQSKLYSFSFYFILLPSSYG